MGDAPPVLTDETEPSGGETADDAVSEQAAVKEAAAEDVPEAVPGPEPAEPGEPSLDVVVQRWDAVLEAVKDRRRRAHSMYEPATPVRLARGVLTLDYPPKYAGFHREQAMSSELVVVLQSALEEVCGFKVAVDAVADGAVDRRPSPPPVTPRDARTAVDPITGGDPDRGAGAPEASGPTANPQADRAASGPDDNPFDRDDPGPLGDGGGASRAAPGTTPPPAAPAGGGDDERSAVLEAEHEGGAGTPDVDTAVATITRVLDAVEVDEADL